MAFREAQGEDRDDHGRQAYAYGKDIPDVVSPFWKVHAISSVYFPEFQNAIEELDRGAAQYKLWMTEAGQRRVAGQINQINERFLEAYKPYQQKRDSLLKALKEFAAKEFN